MLKEIPLLVYQREMDKKAKALFILHYPPPLHGAAKVGEFILSSEKVKAAFRTKFIKLISSNELEEIGKFKPEKILSFLLLFFQVLIATLSFRPKIIYYTVSPGGLPFYRDYLIVSFLKLYQRLFKCELFFHYHSTGVKTFSETSKFRQKLIASFLKNANLILLSPKLKNDFACIKPSYKSISYLANSTTNSLSQQEYEQVLESRYPTENGKTKVLFLSNMVKEKGYWYVLELAKEAKQRGITNVEFHFAGAWRDEALKKVFFSFVQKHQLEDIVTYHGVVSGQKKDDLLSASHLMVFPTRFPKEAFSLVVLEALSFGIPVITSDQAALPDIIDEELGIVVKDLKQLNDVFFENLQKYTLPSVSRQCRNKYLEKYTSEAFENNLLTILSTA